MPTIGERIKSEKSWADVAPILDELGEAALADAVRGTKGSADRVAALGEQLVPVAEALERAANEPKLNISPPLVMDFATGLRLARGGEARRGKPLDWKEQQTDWWTAVDRRGTSWDVSPSGRGRWGVTVADWDRPDWHADSLEEAKALAEEIVARPNFGPQVREIEIPFD
jgi:hypothetical protein